jgi:alpha-tubulin suppressor-like RCC1 family protein
MKTSLLVRSRLSMLGATLLMVGLFVSAGACSDTAVVQDGGPQPKVDSGTDVPDAADATPRPPRDASPDVVRDAGKYLGTPKEDPAVEASYDFLRNITVLRIKNPAEVRAKYPNATFQWERGDGQTFMPLAGVTGSEWFDPAPPARQEPSYRVVLKSDATTFTSEVAKAQTYRVKSMVTGVAFTCALREDNTPVCHGDVNDGTPIPETQAFSQLGAGYFHVCGLKADGAASCWGFDRGGEAPAAAAGPFSAIGGGLFYTCGIAKTTNPATNDRVQCFGLTGPLSDFGLPAVTPAPTEAVGAIATGFRNACAILKVDGTVKCWGKYDVANDNKYVDFPNPTGVFTQIATAPTLSTVCGVLDSGAIKCWGSGFPGDAEHAGSYTLVTAQGGGVCALKTDGKTECFGPGYSAPKSVPPTAPVTKMTSGSLHTCGLAADLTPLCWGRNPDPKSYRPSTAAFTKVVSGAIFSCAIQEDKKLACFGGESVGVNLTLPTGDVTDVAVGQLHVCALTSAGKLVCTGDNSKGAAPPGPSTDTFTSVVAGDEHTCALRADKTVVCFGANNRRQSTPPPGKTFKAIAAGSAHTCGVLEDDTIVCFGDNSAKQAPTTPTMTKFKSVAAGFHHTCGVTDEGVACFGGGDLFESPRLITNPKFTDVVAGSLQTCGLTAEGQVLCYGSAQEVFELSPDTYKSYSTNGLVEDYAGQNQTIDSFTCGVRKDDGKLLCIGGNAFGQAPQL